MRSIFDHNEMSDVATVQRRVLALLVEILLTNFDPDNTNKSR